MFFLGFIYSAVIFNYVESILEVPVVETTFGKVQGVYEESEYGQNFLYMGIPYAHHPPGNYFGDPVDPLSWNGILFVHSSDTKCPQRRNEEIRTTGTIDCLKLNVYLPANRTSTAPMSVLFWIHGGDFLHGSGSRRIWGPELLIANDIIMVSINYRVGPFGTLCLGSREVPGNAGYKDLVKGLKWVRDNIAKFGGNPNDVTLGGSSSGSISVDFLVGSPMTSGLFHRGIMQSGSATTMRYHRSFKGFHHGVVVQMANFLGFNSSDTDECLEFLQQSDPIDIAAAGRITDMFVFCIEREIPGVEAFLTDHPAKIIQEGNFEAVDILTGFNNNEKPLYTDEELDESCHVRFNNAMNYIMYPFEDENEEKSVTNTIRKFYLGSQPITNASKDAMERFLSEFYYIYPTIRSAEVYRRKNKTIYFYEYSYVGGRDYNKYYFPHLNLTGATHVDDLGYLFAQDRWGEPSANDRIMMTRLPNMWANFVKYGDPTPTTTELLPVKWKPALNSGLFYYLKINLNMSLGIDPRKESSAFWSIFQKNYVLFD